MSMQKKKEKEEKKDVFDEKDFDTSVRPQDDFFRYVNGGWLDRTEIPKEESRWGSFDILREENEKKLHALLEEIEQDEEASGDRAKLRDYFRSGMDEKGIEQAGLRDVEETIEKIKSIKDKDEFLRVAGALRKSGTGSCFGISIDQDEKDSETMALQFYQGGLGLPDREYYLKEGKESEEIREKYRKYMGNTLVLAGEEEDFAEKSAQQIFELEKKLAIASKSREALRVPEENYHKLTWEEFQALMRDFGWREYFKGAGIPGVPYVIVGQPKFFEALSKLFKEEPLEVWKVYLYEAFIGSVSGKLGKKFVDEAFLFSQVFTGAKEIRPRWKRVVSEVDGGMGDALGQAYVEKYFSEDSKKRLKEMVEFIREAFALRIKKLDWMSEETKKKALSKLEKIIPKIGYPDTWLSYEKLKIAPDSYVKNHFEACRFDWNREVGKLGKPVDRNEWEMTAPTVNAYFHPTMQEIAFPAGILQPPFFYADADDAVNYGAIGSVIGHELTHGFDDQGRKFDEKGNLNDWWSEEDSRHFEKHADVYAKQFDQFEPLPGEHINGRLTLGENIADLGGAVISYHAFLKSLVGKPEPEKVGGFTARERFFLGWTRAECGKIRPERLKTTIITDPHSPSYYRINGPTSNMDEFYEVFGVKEGDELYRESKDRVKIW